MDEAREKALQELTEYYESKLQEKNILIEQASDEQRQQLREGEELQRQTEEDADREILDLKNRYERQLRQRREENTKLRGEVGILTKKVITLGGRLLRGYYESVPSMRVFLLLGWTRKSISVGIGNSELIEALFLQRYKRGTVCPTYHLQNPLAKNGS